MRKISSMSKDSSSLSKSCFGCYCRHSLVNFTNLVILSWEIWFMYGW